MTYRLAWLTDTHLDRVPWAMVGSLARWVLHARPDALVITGDISEAEPLESHLAELGRNLGGLPTYFVLGNHDFYGGSIPHVRAAAATFSPAVYLPAKGVVELKPKVLLVGVDGWADGLNGIRAKSTKRMNDSFHISQLTLAQVKNRYHSAIRSLGVAEGKKLTGLLNEAIAARPRHIVVATHVPPFSEAAWHRGTLSTADAAPYFSCKSTGDALLNAANANPSIRFTVLCGHAHGEGVVTKCPNLIVRTGGARFADPKPQPPLEIP